MKTQQNTKVRIVLPRFSNNPKYPLKIIYLKHQGPHPPEVPVCIYGYCPSSSRDRTPKLKYISKI